MGHKGTQGFDSVVVSNENRDGERKLAEVLLMLEVLVDRDEYIELCHGLLEQLAIADACPDHLWNGPHDVPLQKPSELTQNRLIDQNAHDL